MKNDRSLDPNFESKHSLGRIPTKSHELIGLPQVRDWWELDLLIPHPKPPRIPKSSNQTTDLNFQIS